MISNQRKLVTVILCGLFVFTATYLEGDGFEIHRFIVGLIGFTEGLLFVRGLEKFDNYAAINHWPNSQKLFRKVLFCFGLMATMIAVDRLIHYTLATYDKDYKIIWTIIIPGTIVVAQFFKLLDFWALENEKKDSTRTRMQ